LSKDVTPSLETKFAGLNFRSPIGVGAIGRPEGANLTPELHAQVLLKHVDAGVGYIYMPTCSYATKKTIRKVKAMAKPDRVHLRFPPGTRTISSVTPVAPYGVEGIFTLVTHPAWMTIERDAEEVEHSLRVMDIVRKRKPQDVLLIANTRGYGSLPDSYVDAAKFWEEQGVDMIEVNLSCPAQPSMTGAVEDYLEQTFSTRWPGALIGQIPDMVENITREVVKAVKIPVGIKLSPETGFPAIVGMARRIRDAGAKFISTVNCAVSIAPPDIYNHGKPLYPFLNGHAFSGSTGSWLRMICYKDVAAIARFAPGIDITAAGGAVIPEHCVEMMMLGARLVQVTTGMMEQGRSLLRRCNSFLKKFMIEQGYRSTEEIIGLGQKYIKYLDELDMSAGKVKAVTDEEKCTNCGVCADQICTVRYMENGRLKVNDANCTGCGSCLISCRVNAIRLVKVVP
jgi:dihydroorotate dehydrogenase/Pyruvate/2-oxoacid:ferredoxin oxidoreductase delta subunit